MLFIWTCLDPVGCCQLGGGAQRLVLIYVYIVLILSLDVCDVQVCLEVTNGY